MLVLSRKLASRLHDRKVQLDVPDDNTVVLRAVPIDADSFSKPRTNLLIKRPQAGQPFLICVDGDLKYTGENHSIRSAFRGQIRQRGWQTLMLLPARGHELEATLTAALSMLGFDDGQSAGGAAAAARSAEQLPNDGSAPAATADVVNLSTRETYASRSGNAEIKQARPVVSPDGLSADDQPAGERPAGDTHTAEEQASAAGRQNPAGTSERNPQLLDMAIDLTAQLKRTPGLPVVGRDEELAAFGSVLYRFGECRLPVVTGESGVGRSAFLRAVAADLAERQPGKRLLVLNAARLVAGVVFNGEYEQVWATVLQEAMADRSLVLVVEHFEMALRGRIPRLLADALDHTRLQLAGVTGTGIVRRVPEPLQRRMCEIRLEELSVPHTIEVLERYAESLSRFHNVTIEPSRLEASVRAAAQLPGHFPAKAMAVLDGAAARAAGQRLEAVTLDDIFTTATAMHGPPDREVELP